MASSGSRLAAVSDWTWTPLLLLTPQSIIIRDDEDEDEGGESVWRGSVGALLAVLSPATPPGWDPPVFGVRLLGKLSCPDANLVTKNFGVIRPLLEALLLPFSNDAVEESGLAQIGDGEGV